MILERSVRRFDEVLGLGDVAPRGPETRGEVGKGSSSEPIGFLKSNTDAGRWRQTGDMLWTTVHRAQDYVESIFPDLVNEYVTFAMDYPKLVANGST